MTDRVLSPECQAAGTTKTCWLIGHFQRTVWSPNGDDVGIAQAVGFIDRGGTRTTIVALPVLPPNEVAPGGVAFTQRPGAIQTVL